MSFQPDPQYVEQLRFVFRQTLGRNNEERKAATMMLDQWRHSRADLVNYLAHIFAHTTAEVDLRASAGLMLKNSVLTEYDRIAGLEYVKVCAVDALTQPVGMLRNIAGSVVSAVVVRGTFKQWPDILPKLINLAQHNDENMQEGALSALAKLFEDAGSELDADDDGQRVLGFMMPRLMELALSPSAKVRAQAVMCLNQFILRQSPALFARIDDFLATIFQLAVDSDPSVRRNICTAFVMLLDVRPDKLLPHLGGIIDYTAHCMADDDEQVALEAGEFLFGLAENAQLNNEVVAFLPKIIPVLLRCMVYSDYDCDRLAENADDADMEDKASDIKPMHPKSRSHGYEEEEDEDDEDDDFSSEWNLRKCSAATLDLFAAKYHEHILQYCVPTLKQNLLSPEWQFREAAILAYGAIAEGCVNGLSPFLPDVLPFFLQGLNDSMAPVRQIACWTLGRYSSWICLRCADVGYEREFVPLLQGLLRCCLDNNKKVQEAGCSGFANFTEHAAGLLVPYLQYILRNLILCFQKYRSKNFTILYDALLTLVDKVGYAMKSKEYADMLLPPLIERWQSLADDDTSLFPLLECLSSVTAALGEFFAPFAAPVFYRAVTILRANLMDQDTDKDFIITTLDLLDGLVQGLGNLATELMNGYDIMEMVLVCMRDEVNEVRQSAFALVGDMAISTFSVLRPYLSSIMTQLIPQIDSSDAACSAVCNNATWAAGEIALQLGQDMRPFVGPLMERLVVVLAVQDLVEKTIIENAAITIGRLGLSCPDMIAPRLEVFASYWCKTLRLIRDTDEKESAYKGMCKIVVLNPAGLKDCLPAFVEAVALYTDPSEELQEMFKTILRGYMSIVPDWESIVAPLPADLRQALFERYNV